jgi:hypothetical protein
VQVVDPLVVEPMIELPAGEARPLTAADERDVTLAGFLVFLDPPKAGAGNRGSGWSAPGSR